MKRIKEHRGSLIKVIIIVALLLLMLLDYKIPYLMELQKSFREGFDRSRYLIILYLFLSVILDFVKNENKKKIYKVRIKAVVILAILAINLELLYKLEIKNIIITKKEIVVFLLNERRIGLYLTMWLYLFNEYLPYNLNLGITGIISFLCILIIFGKVIGNLIRGTINYNSEENRRKRKEVMELIKEERRVARALILEEQKARIKRLEEEKKEKRRKEAIKKKIKELKKEKKFLKKEEQLEQKKDEQLEKKLEKEKIEIKEEVMEKEMVREEKELKETKEESKKINIEGLRILNKR